MQCFYVICILYTKIAELALNVTFWQRTNLTNFTLRLEIQKITNGYNRWRNKEVTSPFGNGEGHGSTGKCTLLLLYWFTQYNPKSFWCCLLQRFLQTLSSQLNCDKENFLLPHSIYRLFLPLWIRGRWKNGAEIVSF